MSNRIIEMDPELKEVYNVVKKNNYIVQEIADDINNIYPTIQNSDFEGQTKDILMEAVAQIEKNITSLTEAANNIIKKENYLNNEFKQKIDEIQKLLDYRNELRKKEEDLKGKLSQARKNQNSMEVM